MRLSQAAEALDAKVCGTDVLFSAVSKDTRTINSGDLYIAIKGENFDGHRFIAQAKTAGAVAAMVSEPQSAELPQLCVADTRLALGQLASHWAQQWRHASQKKLIGVTGSNGKTTVKEMCRHVLASAAGEDRVLSTKGNLNNDIGMPLTLLELREQHQYAVIEMGANHAGEIDYLSQLAKPDIAIITNAAPAHLEGFGSLENVASAKAEIFNGLNAQGVAIINADDAFAPLWIGATKDQRRLLFSMCDTQADIFARELAPGRYQLDTPWGSAEIQLRTPGRHNVLNALAATAACGAAGITLQTIAAALNSFENIQGRLNIVTSRSGATIIDDSYNANPLSVRAAIDVLAAQAGRKILVLGDMAELGSEAATLHGETGRYAKKAGIDVLYALGDMGVHTVNAFGENAELFLTHAALTQRLLAELGEDDVVLVKGSRSAAMEKIVAGMGVQGSLSSDNNSRVN